MIPIRDDTPRYTTPYINYLLIALNSLVFLYQMFILPSVAGPEATRQFINDFALFPIRFEAAVGLSHLHVANASVLPIFTSMFMHSGWLHLIGNMWFLWIFGDNIEDYLGHFSYLVFYLVSGVAASLCHILLNWNSNIPTLGASGAIAAVMGAYFVLFPSARVLMLVPLLFFVTFIWLPAWIVLGYWFIIEFLGGAATTIREAGRSIGGVASWAHVGGFAAGIIMIKLMPQRMNRRSRYVY